MDYPTDRANGYHIGSGTIESAVKQIASQRTKVSGALWNLYFTNTTQQSVTATALDDLVAEGTHNCIIPNNISASGASEYPTSLGVNNVTSAVTDNDSAGISVDESDGVAMDETGPTTDTFAISSNMNPTETVDVPLSTDGECTFTPLSSGTSITVTLPVNVQTAQTSSQ
jgi:hypothetical protein